MESLSECHHTYTHKVMKREQDFWLHFSALRYCQIAAFSPPTHLFLPLSVYSVCVIRNKAWAQDKEGHSKKPKGQNTTAFQDMTIAQPIEGNLQFTAVF